MGRNMSRIQLWRELWACTQSLKEELDARLRADFGKSLPQFELMARLDARPDGISMSELSQLLMVTNGNITGLVGRLIRRRIAKRVRSSVDRREWLVLMTPGGKSQFYAMVEKHEKWVGELLKGLTRPDNLMELLAKAQKSALLELECSRRLTGRSKLAIVLRSRHFSAE
jgi:DNA-binding MarR family transcriptional regulator